MKKILVVAVIVLAAASFTLSQTNRNGAGRLMLVKAAAPVQDCSTLTFQTESLPGFTLNSPANFQIEAVGGTPPYHFQITSGTLPQGLHLNQNGKITGKPTELADTTVFVLLTDSAGCTLTQAFAVRVD